MHRALVVPNEILDHIMSFVADRSALANAARVSRSFNPYAIRWLWNDVETSALYSLCGNLLATRDELGSFMPIEERLSRFQSYACLVRKFELEFDTEPDADWSFEHLLVGLQRAAMLVRNPFIFPGLKELNAGGLDCNSLEALPLFLCPSMETVELRMSEEGHYPEAYESSLSYVLNRLRLCPSLRSLRSDSMVELPADDIRLMLRDCPLLKSLAVDPGVIQPGVFEALANHPNLRRLELYSPEYATLTCIEWDTTLVKKPFVCLVSLSMQCTCEVAMQIFQHIRVSLQELSLTVAHSLGLLNAMPPDAITEKQVVELLSLFESHTSTLRKLDVELTGTISSPSRRLDFATLIGAIAKCSQLRHFYFRLYSPTCIDLQDKDVAVLAKAFPHLTSFSLTWSAFRTGGLYSPAMLTFMSLGYLAAHCPNLQEICFTSLSTGALGTPAHIEQRSHPIALELILQESKAPQPELLAAFLYSIWPNIQLFLRVLSPSLRGWQSLRTVLLGIQLAQKMKTGDDLSPASRAQLYGKVPDHTIIEVGL